MTQWNLGTFEFMDYRSADNDDNVLIINTEKQGTFEFKTGDTIEAIIIESLSSGKMQLSLKVNRIPGIPEYIRVNLYAFVSWIQSGLLKQIK